MKGLVAPSRPCRITHQSTHATHPRLTAALVLVFGVVATRALAMELHSPAFPPNGRLPQIYACAAEGGKSVPPPLRWSDVPPETKSLALTLQDLTSPHKVIHWIVYNIPPARDGDFRVSRRIGEPGRNQLGHLKYDGPCPRHPGQTNRYDFTLYALDRNIAVKNADFSQLQSAMKGHILERAQLVGMLAPPPTGTSPSAKRESAP
ncbi:MAG TPA: YbhB/YbcL family Raf kinase inhibitor-like protein [Candidatus Binataceae bacterium]|nr:YbhB/YbcL family Raf kinase inhibitor-like protein [Candidatus Binataceae bacterium]